VTAALRELGLERPVEWIDVRLRYRALIRTVHPDVAGGGGDATARAAALNSALAVLRAATENGALPLRSFAAEEARDERAPFVASAPTAAPSDQGRVVLRAPAGDVFVQLLDAAHELGDVCYIDPEAGLIQVLLGDGPTAPQLLISVEADRVPALASFTLDSADEASAPALREVVDRLGALLAHP
jgi:hypothetical protein